MNDSHCHFFSRRFFQTLAGEAAPGQFTGDLPTDVCRRLGWDPPGEPAALAARWIEELDRQQVDRAVLIASVPGDEESVAAAVAAAPSRFVGFFMVNPLSADALERTRRGLGRLGLKGVCLFPAMHRYALQDPRVQSVIDTVAATPGAVLFVHCGVLTVGIRQRLGLPSRFDVRYGNPLDLHAVALAHPSLPVLIPHFGAGFFREALMVADLCPNIHLDTSSSNRWIEYHPNLTLTDVFRQALLVVGPSRLLFGTDSSFFPRGWNRDVWTAQAEALRRLAVSEPDQAAILAGNFDRLFPAG